MAYVCSSIIQVSIGPKKILSRDCVIEGVIEEEALTGTLILKANGKWIYMPMVNTKGKLKSHTKILDSAIHLSKEDKDSMTTSYNLEPNFVVDILTNKDYKGVEPINHNINCHTEGSKLDDNRTGAGVLQWRNVNYVHHSAPPAEIFGAPTKYKSFTVS